MLAGESAKTVQDFYVSGNWALAFALFDKQQITLGLSGEMGFGFRHMAHHAARQTSRIQSPVRKQRVFFVLGGIYRLALRV